MGYPLETAFDYTFFCILELQPTTIRNVGEPRLTGAQVARDPHRISDFFEGP